MAAGMFAQYLVLVTDMNLAWQGDPIACWDSLDITLRHNEPSAGIMTCPAYPWVRDQLTPGCRIVVIRDGEILIAGPMEQRLRERSDNGENAGIGKLRVTFADDLAKIVGREVYPNPAQTPSTQTSDNWTFSGNAELALRALVNGNAGPLALAARRVPQLVMGAVNGVGVNVAVTATRMQDLGDVARAISEASANLVLRAEQVGNQIVVGVTEPVNKAGEIRFGYALGNMRYSAFELSAPTATVAIVGGQGTGADRFMIERVNSVDAATWGRYETLVARAGSSPAQSLEDDGDAALADAAARTRLTTNVADSPTQRYGHYHISDIVSVESDEGQEVSDIIRTVHFQAYATAGEYVSATIGNQSAMTSPAWVRRMRAIDERLGRLERTVVPAA